MAIVAPWVRSLCVAVVVVYLQSRARVAFAETKEKDKKASQTDLWFEFIVCESVVCHRRSGGLCGRAHSRPPGGHQQARSPSMCICLHPLHPEVDLSFDISPTILSSCVTAHGHYPCLSAWSYNSNSHSPLCCVRTSRRFMCPSSVVEHAGMWGACACWNVGCLYMLECGGLVHAGMWGACAWCLCMLECGACACWNVGCLYVLECGVLVRARLPQRSKWCTRWPPCVLF
jgi:hypothetical protein